MWNLFICCQLLMNMRPAQEWLIHLHWREPAFPLPVAQMSNNFLARDRAPCPFPLLCVGIFWCELSQALSPRHSLCELLCASTLSESYNLSTFSSIYIPKPQGEGFDKDTPFRAECSKVLHSLFMPFTEEEASLMRAEWGTGLWVERYVTGSPLVAALI